LIGFKIQINRGLAQTGFQLAWISAGVLKTFSSGFSQPGFNRWQRIPEQITNQFSFLKSQTQ
jgi:hypothetical protein